MKNLLERIVRYYFKKYHKNKVYEVFIPCASYGYLECGDVLEVRGSNTEERAMYLGKAEYMKLWDKQE